MFGIFVYMAYMLSKNFHVRQTWVFYSGIIGGVTGGLIGFISLLLLPSPEKSGIQCFWADFPEVKQLLASKWRIGEQPEERFGHKYVLAEAKDFPEK